MSSSKIRAYDIQNSQVYVVQKSTEGAYTLENVAISTNSSVNGFLDNGVVQKIYMVVLSSTDASTSRDVFQVVAYTASTTPTVTGTSSLVYQLRPSQTTLIFQSLAFVLSSTSLPTTPPTEYLMTGTLDLKDQVAAIAFSTTDATSNSETSFVSNVLFKRENTNLKATLNSLVSYILPSSVPLPLKIGDAYQEPVVSYFQEFFSGLLQIVPPPTTSTTPVSYSRAAIPDGAQLEFTISQIGYDATGTVLTTPKGFPTANAIDENKTAYGLLGDFSFSGNATAPKLFLTNTLVEIKERCGQSKVRVVITDVQTGVVIGTSPWSCVPDATAFTVHPTVDVIAEYADASISVSIPLTVTGTTNKKAQGNCLGIAQITQNNIVFKPSLPAARNNYKIHTLGQSAGLVGASLGSNTTNDIIYTRIESKGPGQEGLLTATNSGVPNTTIPVYTNTSPIIFTTNTGGGLFRG